MVCPTYSFLLLFHNRTFGNGRIDNFTDLLNDLFIIIDIINTDKICDSVCQKIEFLSNVIGCEAQEGVE